MYFPVRCSVKYGVFFSQMCSYTNPKFITLALVGWEVMATVLSELALSTPPWRGVLPEKLRVLQLVNKFPTFYKTHKVHHRLHNSPPPVPVLSRINPVYAIKRYVFKFCFNIILASTPRPSKLSFSSGFLPPDPACIYFLLSSCYMPSSPISLSSCHHHCWGL